MTKTLRITVGLCLVALVAVLASALWGPFAAKQRFEATVAEYQKQNR